MKIGRLTVVGEKKYTSKSGKTHPGYLCKCDCGNYKTVCKSDFLGGKVKSCGCLIRDFNKTKIGNVYATMKKGNKNPYNRLVYYKRIRSIWKNMRSRCENPNATSYNDYGGRGISVCDEWHQFIYFYNWAISNGYSDELSIDRIDVDGNYCPANCRWATAKEQARNKRINKIS